MNRKEKIATIIMMLAGMMFGVILLMMVPAKPHDYHQLLKDSIPSFNMKGERKSMMDLINLLKARRRIELLSAKDSLTSSDSLEIMQIDQQLNHMFHD